MADEDITLAGAETGKRRERILSAALDLFEERGFHGTGLADIGKAVGVTAAALYRNFESKSDILAKAMQLTADRLVAGINEAAAAPPAEALELLLRNHIAVAVDDSALVRVWFREERNHPDPGWAVQAQNQYIDAFVLALSRVRPELPYADVRTLVHAALSLILSAALYNPRLGPERLKAVLFELARNVCAADVPASDPEAQRLVARPLVEGGTA